MPEPSEKSPQIESFLEDNFGRTTAIRGGKCVFCTDPNMNFRDEISRKEYAISGLCQRCQDEVFKDTDEEE